jgi:hypothetical protein
MEPPVARRVIDCAGFILDYAYFHGITFLTNLDKA